MSVERDALLEVNDDLGRIRCLSALLRWALAGLHPPEADVRLALYIVACDVEELAGEAEAKISAVPGLFHAA